MNESTERLSKAMEKFRDSDPVDEDDLANADYMVAYHKGRFWRAKRMPGTPLELHAFRYGVKTASMQLIDRGEVVPIPINNIFTMDNRDWLRKPAPFCFRAHIADVIPVAEDGKWSDMATSCFVRYTWRRDDLKMIQRGPLTETSMPVELLFTESFTDDPFTPTRTVETTMSRKLMYEDHARAKPLENDQFFDAAADDNTSEFGTSSTLDETMTIPEEFEPIVSHWLPPNMIMLGDNESAMIRITAVDGVFQFYGHLKEAKYQIRSMRNYHDGIYDELVDHPEDSKEGWRLGEACVAKRDNHWYRAQVVDMSQSTRKVLVLYVDLGSVREVDIKDLRIPRAFQNKVCNA